MAKKDEDKKAKPYKGGIKMVTEEEELSEEEAELKERLDLYVERVQDVDPGLQKVAMESLRSEIQSATSSMTSVPLPLKFLAVHYPTLKEFYTDMEAGSNRKALADILSVLAMTHGSKGKRESLDFKLAGNTTTLGEWGHEFVRNLAGEIGTEYQERREKDDEAYVGDLVTMIEVIVPFKMQRKAEYEAMDLLMEVERLDDIVQWITKDNCAPICKYLITSSDYIGDPEEATKMLMISYDAYLKHGSPCNALRVAIKMNKPDIILATVNFVEGDDLMRKQLAFILASQRIVLPEFEDDDDLMEVMGNVTLSHHYLTLAKELDVLEPKAPADIYKTHLEEPSLARRTRTTATATVDSARNNLASTFVNAFVNCGFGKDALITPEGSEWLYKNKSHGMLSASASLGMIKLWDVDTGFSAVDKYSFSAQPQIKAGALLATGMLSSGVTSEMDAALALLSDPLNEENTDAKVSAALGLGLAYAGSSREDVLETLAPIMVEDNQPIDVVATCCLALGLVFVGTGDENVSGNIIEVFLDRSDTDMETHSARLMCLGMGLLFLGQGEKVEGALAAVKAIESDISKYLELTLETCAYMGTGSVLAVQKLTQLCTEHLSEPEDDDTATTTPPTTAVAAAGADAAGTTAAADGEASTDDAKAKAKREYKFKSMAQEVGVLGIAMVAMGEHLASQMALRTLDHMLQYGEVNIRRSVPLALALLSVSNPQLTVMDTLSKLSHDQDEQVSQNAILALGFIGAGTNNSRIATLLRQLATYYGKDANHLFITRISQGLLHMGKGLTTLNPFHSDNLLFSPVGAAGLLTVLHSAFDLKRGILDKRHYLLFSLVCSVRPRMLVCLDEDLEPVPVSVRVGQAVDSVAMSGKPKQITGFQTHTTPVLLGAGERAELATEEFIALTPILEGFVIVKRNPEAVEEEKKDKKK